MLFPQFAKILLGIYFTVASSVVYWSGLHKSFSSSSSSYLFHTLYLPDKPEINIRCHLTWLTTYRLLLSGQKIRVHFCWIITLCKYMFRSMFTSGVVMAWLLQRDRGKGDGMKNSMLPTFLWHDNQFNVVLLVIRC